MNEKNNDIVHIIGKNTCGGGTPIYSISYHDIMGIKYIDKVTKIIRFSEKHVEILCVETPSQIVERIMRLINEPIKDENKLRLKLYDMAFEGDTIATGLIFILNRYQYYLSIYENNPQKKFIIQNHTINLIRFIYSTELSRENDKDVESNNSIHKNWTTCANLIEHYEFMIANADITQYTRINPEDIIK